jgi:hypothetical protein
MSTLTKILETYIEKDPEVIDDYASSKELLDTVNGVIRDFKWLPNEVKKEVLYLSKVYAWGLFLSAVVTTPAIIAILIATFSNKFIMLFIIPVTILHCLGLYPYVKILYIKSKYRFDVFKLKSIELKIN